MNAMTSDAASSAGVAKTSRRALVLGASMAGLWTARVLADTFDEVVVLERDRLPDGVAPRPGAPQARQYHVLLLRGLQLLRAYFPGWRKS